MRRRIDQPWSSCAAVRQGARTRRPYVHAPHPNISRIPYISARTALGKIGTELGSYTEIVDFMQAYAADPQSDFRELFLRLVFTILVSNKDDHLKSHGFLYVELSLAPVADFRCEPCTGSQSAS